MAVPGSRRSAELRGLGRSFSAVWPSESSSVTCPVGTQTPLSWPAAPSEAQLAQLGQPLCTEATRLKGQGKSKFPFFSYFPLSMLPFIVFRIIPKGIFIVDKKKKRTK